MAKLPVRFSSSYIPIERGREGERRRKRERIFHLGCKGRVSWKGRGQTNSLGEKHEGKEFLPLRLQLNSLGWKKEEERRLIAERLQVREDLCIGKAIRKGSPAWYSLAAVRPDRMEKKSQTPCVAQSSRKMAQKQQSDQPSWRNEAQYTFLSQKKNKKKIKLKFDT